MPQIEGMTQRSLSKFLEGMRIVDVAYYGNPQAIHLFLASRSAVGINALLCITALDEGVLHITLDGNSQADEGPQEEVPTLEEYPF